jgi:hypothetical protein
MGALTVARCSDAAGCYRPGGSGGCAAFPKGNIYLRLRDEIGPLFDDAMFAALFPERGQPAAHPWRLAPMTVMQFMEGLSDRQCAEAVRGLSACASARRRRKGAGSTVSAPMTPRSIVHLFGLMYGELGLVGCSSHSGRRTFGTRAARKVVEAGGSLRDVQQLLGHKDLSTTQKYIDGSEEAKRRLVQLI